MLLYATTVVCSIYVLGRSGLVARVLTHAPWCSVLIVTNVLRKCNGGGGGVGPFPARAPFPLSLVNMANHTTTTNAR